jgi:heme/copper-type cytochrome/quinol oxidase subunit 2
MFTRFRTLVLAGLTIATLGLFALSPALAAAQTPPPDPTRDAVCQGVGYTGGTSDCKEDATHPNVASIIASVINILSIIVGVATVIMIIIGGFRYVVSGGDSNSISSAKNTILYAIVGLVIVVFAQGIVRFVLNKINPATTTPSSSVQLTVRDETRA